MTRVWMLLLLAGCVDKAKADYDRCVERDQGYDVKGAVESCQAAVAADPKSVSGQAAAKKLLDLDRVADKLKTEQQEKLDRDAKIKKDDPPLVIVHSADTAAAAPPTPYEQAFALNASGDQAGARAILDPRVGAGKATLDEAKLLRDICKAQQDRKCAKLLAKYAAPLRQ
ncbi:MAG TPA: hypothetical protein VGH87_11475 [Polyangiaceae bacterium]|nr:hypothetical protein [Polyangiaceae bacterium]